MSDLKLLKGKDTGTGILIENEGFISPSDIRNAPFINEIKKIGESKNVMVEPLIVFAVLQKFGVLNKNGRFYPEKVLKRESEKYQELINQRQALGESNHPEATVIDNDRISHEVRKIWWEGKTLVGEIEIIMSPGFINYGIISCVGDQIANYLRKGIQIGVSSRGVGTLEESRDGYNIVQDDFELICWDIVTRPSTPGSYIFNRAEEARPFMESENKKNNLIDNLNKFLLD